MTTTHRTGDNGSTVPLRGRSAAAVRRAVYCAPVATLAAVLDGVPDAFVCPHCAAPPRCEPRYARDGAGREYDTGPRRRFFPRPLTRWAWVVDDLHWTCGNCSCVGTTFQLQDAILHSAELLERFLARTDLHEAA